MQLQFENGDQWRYFKLFREQTGKGLSGFFDSDVWTKSILQMGYDELFLVPVRNLISTYSLLDGET